MVQARILDDRELMAVASKKEEIRFGVDSGAALTVVRSDVATDYPVTRERKRSLRTADGQSIPDLGSKEIMLKEPSSWFVKTAVADVAKNLLSVSPLVDAGHEVIFFTEEVLDHAHSDRLCERD